MTFTMASPKIDDDARAPDEVLRDVADSARDDLVTPHSRQKLGSIVFEMWKLVRPRSWSLACSFLLILINRFCGFAVPVSSRYLINNVMYRHQMESLPLILGAVVGATFVQASTTYALDRYLGLTGQRVIAELRVQVQAHIGRLPLSFYDENRAGTLVARIMTDVEGVRNLIGAGLLELLGGVLTAVIALVILIRISTLMTVLTFCILLVFAWFLKKALGMTRPIFRERSRINAEVTGRLTESLGGIRVIKGYHAEESEARVFAEGVDHLLQNISRSIAVQSLMSLCSTMVLGVVGALVMYLGAMETASHHIDVGAYVEFILLLAFMVAPVALLVSVGTQLTEAFVGLDRTSELLDELTEDREASRNVSIDTIRGDIVFEEVTFAYLAGKPVLHGVSFKSRPGTVTALVGSSGSGKSTIISLICAFHTATGGHVLIDGTDLSTVRLSSFRQQLGVVLQETFLFDGTIDENIRFSRPHATREQFLEACRIACVDEFAEKFPERYGTLVGERGIKLSGGQRQRISIARAILANPRILILDEATSSLDSESEAMIQNGLRYLMQGRTTFVIAHRLSTIRRAQQILVIEGGRIVERGEHESLYEKRGRYYDLYTRQHGLETNLFLAPGEGDTVV
jgi:ABC-type multidrug transport system fused ATPase/permease subunit